MQVAEQDSAERTPRPHLRAYRLGLGLRALGLKSLGRHAYELVDIRITGQLSSNSGTERRTPKSCNSNSGDPRKGTPASGEHPKTVTGAGAICGPMFYYCPRQALARPARPATVQYRTCRLLVALNHEPCIIWVGPPPVNSGILGIYEDPNMITIISWGHY